MRFSQDNPRQHQFRIDYKIFDAENNEISVGDTGLPNSIPIKDYIWYYVVKPIFGLGNGSFLGERGYCNHIEITVECDDPNIELEYMKQRIAANKEEHFYGYRLVFDDVIQIYDGPEDIKEPDRL